MNESWEPVSDEDDDDYCLADQALEYDMWEGQFDLIATDSITDYSERFNSEDLSCLSYFIPLIDPWYEDMQFSQFHRNSQIIHPYG